MFKKNGEHYEMNTYEAMSYYQSKDIAQRVISPPVRCFLCNADHEIVTARFTQLYSQKDAAPVPLYWWECRACGGWFVYPVPAPEVIKRHWLERSYQDPASEIKIAQQKDAVQQRILRGLSRWTDPGTLLDFGCNFGQFLVMARQAGWTPSGFDPYVTAAEKARAKGFEVHCGWNLEEAGFPDGHFAAITANDSFYYVWHPYTMLETFHRLLKPGGVLAMRLANKRFAWGLARAFSAAGPVRDLRISEMLMGQFHGIGMAPLSRILQDVGFDRVRVESHAMTASWHDSSWKTRIVYLVADMLYFTSLKRVNLSPGVLLFARKAN